MKKVLLTLLMVICVFAFVACKDEVTEKQVPVYEGMTVSSATEVASDETKAVSLASYKKFAKKTDLDPEGCDYYADLGEEIYINIHINNPDEFEILSFTLNGAKYSDYMFESGSNMDTIIIKCNVGNESGIKEYTIDAIKYVDKQAIKDVVFKGEKTISIHVSNNDYVPENPDINPACQHDDPAKIVFLEGKMPTCLEKGLTEGQYCSACGETLVAQQEIPLSGHTEEIIPAVDPTCTSTGLTEGKRCSVCETILIAQNVAPKIDHIYSSVVVTKPTRYSQGYTTYTCKCGDSYVDDYVAVLTHSEGLKYRLNNDGKSYSVTGIGSCADVDIVIPTTYNDKPVTSIGDTAFQFCTSIISVAIPDTVTYIGQSPFLECTSLVSIEVDENNQYYKSNDGYLYTKDGIVLIQYAIGKQDTTVTISNSVLDIATAAFNGCTSLTSVVINAGRCIGSGAFDGCTSLKNVTICNSVKSIYGSAFQNCTSLTSINFEGTIEQWNAISFESNWNYSVPATYVQCSDGIVPLN